jgi:hypothetical protein
MRRRGIGFQHLAISFQPLAFSQTGEGWQEKHNPEAFDLPE